MAEPPIASIIQAGVILFESCDASPAVARQIKPNVDTIPAQTEVIFGPNRSKNSPANRREPIDATNPMVERTANFSCCPEQKTPQEQDSAKTPSLRRMSTSPGKPKTRPPEIEERGTHGRKITIVSIYQN